MLREYLGGIFDRNSMALGEGDRPVGLRFRCDIISFLGHGSLINYVPAAGKQRTREDLWIEGLIWRRPSGRPCSPCYIGGQPGSYNLLGLDEQIAGVCPVLLSHRFRCHGMS